MDLLEALPLGSFVDGEPAIMELLRQHPRYNEKTAGGNLRIRKDWKLVVVDGEGKYLRDFGWSKATRVVDGKPVGLSKREVVERAARNIVHHQIAQFRKDNGLDSNVEVAHAGKGLSTLLEEWAQARGINVEDIQIRRGNRGYRVFADRSLAGSWDDWHEHHAILRGVSKREHVQETEKERAGVIATCCSGPTLKKGVLTKGGVAAICRQLTKKWGVSVVPEGIGRGFLLVEVGVGYKCMRLHARGGEWPWIRGGETERWEGDETVIYSDLKGASTTLKAFDGAPAWTLGEVRDVVDALAGCGVTVLKKSIPAARDLVSVGGFPKH
jgi:hypothetical protein